MKIFRGIRYAKAERFGQPEPIAFTESRRWRKNSGWNYPIGCREQSSARKPFGDIPVCRRKKREK
jgi:hypothetical protein